MNAFKMSSQLKFLVYVFFFISNINKTSGIPEASSKASDHDQNCLESEKMVTFATLAEFRENQISFEYNSDEFRGNRVNFTTPTINSLEENSLLTKYGNWVMGLYLNGKSISRVEPGTFRYMSCLRTLDLSNNTITILKQGVFKGAPKLRTINLSRNKIYIVHDNTFESLTSVQNLDFSWNKIIEIEDNAFKNISLLQNLRLNQNFLKTLIYNVFRYVKKLEFLDLSYNSLVNIDYLGGMITPQLMSLNLSHNLIYRLPENLMIYSLEELRLEHNNFENLDIVWLKTHFVNLNFIDFGNNRFSCDNLIKIQENLKKRNVLFEQTPKCIITKYFEEDKHKIHYGWIILGTVIIFAVPLGWVIYDNRVTCLFFMNRVWHRRIPTSEETTTEDGGGEEIEMN